MQSFLSKARVPFMGSLLAALAVLSGCARVEMGTSGQKDKSGSAGSSQCRTCHPGFYKKWATSHHGLAMQPFTAEFAKASLRPQDSALTVGAATYQAVFEAEGGFQEEKGPKGVRRLPMVQVMGGKNTYYFLTPMERGRLQVLPLAYDVQKQQWYDMAASGVRMHAEGHSQRPLEWTDSAYTFNTACYSCHVSQLRTNYDLASDTYHSSWREPGINCETCHGDGAAHVALYENDLTAKHEDMRILRTTRMTPAQRNEMCAPCHAKMSPISAGYEATQRFFDHYDLVTLEDPDYYPDGRDLGENYTFTSWLMSPCIRNGKFDCIHCHTSSGRYRFATENPNGACQPCHQDVVAKVEAHSHHKAGTPGGNCIDCHMPKTRFANMNRSDHSMLPPTPAVTMKHQSPNACNLCHKNKPASWADAKVRQWFPEDYQKPVLARAALVDQARRGRWEALPEMIAYVQAPEGDIVTQASLLRLMRTSSDPGKMPALIQALGHANPLIRAAAAASVAGTVSVETRDALAKATADEYRLVRIRAAASLAGMPWDGIPGALRQKVENATAELVASYKARPDDFANHTNLGNFYLDRGQLQEAIQSYETAIRLRPDSVGTLVNASMAYSRAGRLPDAERALDQALRFEPGNAPANFNRGLLLAEMGRKAEAEAALKQAVASDSGMAAAAFNLCVLMMERKDPAGVAYCERAAKADPRNEKYAFSLAFYMAGSGRTATAMKVMEEVQQKLGSLGPDSRMLLAELYARNGRKRDAETVYRAMLNELRLSPDQQRSVESRLRALQPR